MCIWHLLVDEQTHALPAAGSHGGDSHRMEVPPSSVVWKAVTRQLLIGQDDGMIRVRPPHNPIEPQWNVSAGIRLRSITLTMQTDA